MPIALALPPLNQIFYPQGIQSNSLSGPKQLPKNVVCKDCQEPNLSWGWNYYRRKAILVDSHNGSHTCHKKDIFPGWCFKCNAPELSWVRKNDRFELIEAYGLPHACELEEEKAIEDMSETSCKFCHTKDLLWTKVRGKFSILCTNGLPHTCQEKEVIYQAQREAYRMDYAFEKKWLKSIPDGSLCKKCQGKGWITKLTKNKRLMAKYHSTTPINLTYACKPCKGIGSFTVRAKQNYLSQLRRKYWPYKPHFKWNPRK